MAIRWERKTEKFECGFRGYVGKVALFSVDYDDCVSRDDKLKWCLKSSLPGLVNRRLQRNEHDEECRVAAQGFLDKWLAATGLHQ